MSISKSIAVVLLGICCFFLTLGSGFAEEKFVLKQSSVIREILFDNVGRRVSVRLDAGEELNGAVVKVGDQLVHLSRLSGKEYFDAVIRIDKISAVIFRTVEK